MSRTNESCRTPAPTWLCVAGSVPIALHLIAVAGSALGAPSGPWPVAGGSDWATPPQFAQSVNESGVPYLAALKMTHNYHFLSNRPTAGHRFEARLFDREGRPLQTLQFPDPDASFSVRHRQGLLADSLADDTRVEPLPGEFVPAPDQVVRKVNIWRMQEGRRAIIEKVEEHLVPRDHEVYGPSEWSMLVARSFARRLGRVHDAASVGITRITREHIPPDVLYLDAPPPAGAFDESIMEFGVFDVATQND